MGGSIINIWFQLHHYQKHNQQGFKLLLQETYDKLLNYAEFIIVKSCTNIRMEIVITIHPNKFKKDENFGSDTYTCTSTIVQEKKKYN